MNQLFVYGTLQLEKVQQEVFGRYDPGTPDSLEGYTKTTIEINNNTYPILDKGNDLIYGIVIEVTNAELIKIDEYETDNYQRIKVTLKSEREAWVYVK